MKLETGAAFRPRAIGIAGAYLALAAAVFFLAFCNLDGRLFWGDEAETALLSKNVLKYGVPKVDDGINHISIHGDQYDARDGVWTWSPWLQDYLTAGSFAIFGATTWAGRAPFAFIGWLAVLLLGFVAWKIYRSHRIALASIFLLGTSEVFLLHIRQCRYYSITALAGILLAYGIYQILAKNKNAPWWILAGQILLFYCNYTSAFANVPTLLILEWRLFLKDRTSARRLAMSLAIWLVISLPWLLFAETWRQGSFFALQPVLDMLRFYAWQIHFHFFPWCFALLPVCGWLFHRLSKSHDSKIEDWQNAARRFEKYLILLSLLYVPSLLVMPNAFSRYLLPILPLLCLLVAAWLFRYIKWTAVAAVIIVVQCFTNIFAVATDPFGQEYPLRSPFADFLFSSLLPYQDRLTDVLKFFDKQARPGDTVLSRDPEFPLIFYTKLKVIDARLASPQRLPDWILPESVTGDLKEKPIVLSDSLKPHYEKIILTVHDSAQVDNIPEPEAYQLQTATSFSPFIIYKLKGQTTPAAR